ncbi:MAG: substrate-binding domain-containing protein, partial [Mycobacterium sp.]
MKLSTVGRVLLAIAVTGLTLVGCGSDNNTGGTVGTETSTTAPGPAECSGKNALTAEGSTSQQNAIALFNQAWGKLCPGKNMSYNPTGSGAGREQFIAGHVDFAGSDSPL